MIELIKSNNRTMYAIRDTSKLNRCSFWYYSIQRLLKDVTFISSNMLDIIEENKITVITEVKSQEELIYKFPHLLI